MAINRRIQLWAYGYEVIGVESGGGLKCMARHGHHHVLTLGPAVQCVQKLLYCAETPTPVVLLRWRITTRRIDLRASRKRGVYESWFGVDVTGQPLTTVS